MTATKIPSKFGSHGVDVGRRKLEAKLDTYSGRVAARLRELREKKGWDVSDVVDRLPRDKRVTKTAMYRYESGMRVLPPDLYPHLAAMFGLSIAKFLPPE